MNLEVLRDSKKGIFKFSFKRHVFVSTGLLFVAGGIAALAGPWWLPIAEAVLGKAGLRVEPSHQWILGIGLIVIGLSFLAYKHFALDKEQRRLDADRIALAPTIDQIESVRNYLRTLGDDHSYWSSLDTVFYNSIDRHLRQESALQIPETATLYKSFSRAGGRLHSFVGQNFFEFPRGASADGDHRYCMWPQYNIDREMISYDAENAAKYDSFSDDLATLLREVERSFNDFIEHLNRSGHISKAVV